VGSTCNAPILRWRHLRHKENKYTGHCARCLTAWDRGNRARTAPTSESSRNEVGNSCSLRSEVIHAAPASQGLINGVLAKRGHECYPKTPFALTPSTALGPP